jgi:hypothetical protein
MLRRCEAKRANPQSKKRKPVVEAVLGEGEGR